MKRQHNTETQTEQNLVFNAPLTEGNLRDNISGTDLKMWPNCTYVWDATYKMYKFSNLYYKNLSNGNYFNSFYWDNLNLNVAWGIKYTELEMQIEQTILIPAVHGNDIRNMATNTFVDNIKKTIFNCSPQMITHNEMGLQIEKRIKCTIKEGFLKTYIDEQLFYESPKSEAAMSTILDYSYANKYITISPIFWGNQAQCCEVCIKDIKVYNRVL